MIESIRSKLGFWQEFFYSALRNLLWQRPNKHLGNLLQCLTMAGVRKLYFLLTGSLQSTVACLGWAQPLPLSDTAMGQAGTVLHSEKSQHSVVTASRQGQSTGRMTDASKVAGWGMRKQNLESSAHYACCLVTNFHLHWEGRVFF